MKSFIPFSSFFLDLIDGVINVILNICFDQNLD